MGLRTAPARLGGHLKGDHGWRFFDCEMKRAFEWVTRLNRDQRARDQAQSAK
jgi:S-formylglutathione hydrolase FrmB